MFELDLELKVLPNQRTNTFKIEHTALVFVFLLLETLRSLTASFLLSVTHLYLSDVREAISYIIALLYSSECEALQ